MSAAEGRRPPLENALALALAPVQRNGYRYTPAEGVPWLAGSPAVRRAIGPHVLLSHHDRARAVEVARDDARVAFAGRNGYRTVMGTEGVAAGEWYFEVAWAAEAAPAPAHLRFGVALMGGDVLGPVGMDAFGFAWCDSGDTYHAGQRRKWAEPFRPGDVLGCLVRLGAADPRTEARTLIAAAPPRRTVQYYGVYLEERLPAAVPALILAGSEILFFRNGEPQGVAFRGLPAGVYYPALSPYPGSAVRANFGPRFAHAPAAPARAWSQILPTNRAASNLADLREALLPQSIKK